MYSWLLQVDLYQKMDKLSEKLSSVEIQNEMILNNLLEKDATETPENSLLQSSIYLQLLFDTFDNWFKLVGVETQALKNVTKFWALLLNFLILKQGKSTHIPLNVFLFSKAPPHSYIMVCRYNMKVL